MSLFTESTEEIVSDAIPSPPREENTKEQNKKPTFKGHRTNCRPKNTHNFPKELFNQFKVPPASAFASVINISNANGVHIGSNYNLYMDKSNAADPETKNFTVTPAIKSMFISNDPVTKDDILFLAPHLNSQWRDTARALRYSDGQIDQFYEDFIRSGIKEVIYQLFLDWIRDKVDEATIGQLSKALWESNQKDVVSTWSQKLQK